MGGRRQADDDKGGQTSSLSFFFPSTSRARRFCLCFALVASFLAAPRPFHPRPFSPPPQIISPTNQHPTPTTNTRQPEPTTTTPIEGIQILRDHGFPDVDPLGDLNAELERALGAVVKQRYG